MLGPDAAIIQTSLFILQGMFLCGLMYMVATETKKGIQRAFGETSQSLHVEEIEAEIVPASDPYYAGFSRQSRQRSESQLRLSSPVNNVAERPEMPSSCAQAEWKRSLDILR
ncbi:MAG: hypothetical protein AAFW68_01775 [Pseudomonadota bacterium]